MSGGTAAPATEPPQAAAPAAPRRGGRLRSVVPRIAPRHSALRSPVVVSLKILLPAAAVALVMLVLMWSRFSPDDQRFSIPKVVVKPEDLENLKMEAPRYVGIDAQNQPFTVTARLATQGASGSPLTELEEPKGDILLSAGSWIAVEARQGVYDKSAETLDLSGDVSVFHDRGYQLRTERARVFLSPGEAEGDAPVHGQGPDTELRGAGFRLEAKGARILLLGESRIVFFPQEPGQSRPGIVPR
ncbi:MAG: LPS export ABC transporter periplasmic protein LptC [Alphaproteobacteria bacterium]